MSTRLGVQSYGFFVAPTSSRIGLGDWHSFCSSLGSWRKARAADHTGFLREGSSGSVSLVPCLKSNAPGPSVVPPAKLLPRAAEQVWTWREELNGYVKLNLDMSWKKWKEEMVEAGIRSRSGAPNIACAAWNWRPPISKHDFVP